MKICYIAHPIGGNVGENLTKIGEIVQLINLSEPEIVPFAPYFVDCIVLDDDDPQERARGLANGRTVLASGAVDELWLYGDRISEGMWGEIDVAHKTGIPIRPQTEATRKAWLVSGARYFR